MKMYLTFNDPFSGVYSSQVIDVVNYLNKEVEAGVRLVAFVSLRNFSTQHKQIKREIPTALVLPMFPTLNAWMLNSITLWILLLFWRPSVIVCRSILAFNLARVAGKWLPSTKLVYDGRGAIDAEWHEYDLINSQHLKNNSERLERLSLNASDFQVAVSHKLVIHWQQKFGYSASNHVVIPCTLSTGHHHKANAIDRSVMGFTADHVVLVFSGSLAGWQSIDSLIQLLRALMLQENVRILFLCRRSIETDAIEKEFPGRVFITFVRPAEVNAYLVACDYGMLIREPSITNQVASPVKLAEYLVAGLDVIISPKVGDYSEFVLSNKCGFLVDSRPASLSTLSREKRTTNTAIAMHHFSKQRYHAEYRAMLQASLTPIGNQ